MAACKLTIELDEPATPRLAGQPVAGTVVVTTTGVVKCDGLAISSYWTTHGRGNIEKGEVDRCAAFEGTWEADREYRYPFSLRCADWPPTYYGTYLNVSHFVGACAKVPWSSDPKTQVEFTVLAPEAPADLMPTRAAKPRSTKLVGWIIGAILLLVFGAMFGVLLLFLLPIVAIAGAYYWLSRVFLPRRLLGKVECTVDPVRVTAGATVNGRLRFTPRRDVTTGGIVWTLTCTEKCTSGSGTTATTHRHVVFTKSIALAEAGLLRLGQSQAFEFACPIPEQAPVSLKFMQNELTWLGELRVEIPRWPDWLKSFRLTVVPSGVVPVAPFATGAEAATAIREEETWFGEVVQQVERSCEDPARLQAVLAAVQSQTFSLRLDITGPRAEPPEQHRSEAGTWMFAVYRPRNAKLCLLWPTPLEPPGQAMSNWRGTATIIGYDERLGCLLMRVGEEGQGRVP